MIKNTYNYNLDNLHIPEVCPICNGDLEILENGKVRCVNKFCKQKIAHKITKFLDTLEVKGAGPSYTTEAAKDCKNLYEYLESVVKTYDDSVKWAGGINGKKVVDRVRKVLTKSISISQYIACFDIEGVSEGQIDKVCKAVPDADLNFFLHPTSSTQFICEGIKDKLADTMYSGLVENTEELEACTKFFSIKTTTQENTAAKTGSITGLSFCFTGKACRPRKELETLVVENGGSVSTVKKGLSYLVTDDTESGSSKNVKAAQLGIPVITSETFLKMVGI